MRVVSWRAPVGGGVRTRACLSPTSSADREYSRPAVAWRVVGEDAAGAERDGKGPRHRHVETPRPAPDLLERATDLLEADTATVLLVDASGTDLVARAARGIEEEVRQGVRVPVGSGSAGRIAAEGRPVILDQVDETTVTNPILWRKGIRSMLGVPLLADGRGHRCRPRRLSRRAAVHRPWCGGPRPRRRARRRGGKVAAPRGGPGPGRGDPAEPAPQRPELPRRVRLRRPLRPRGARWHRGRLVCVFMLDDGEVWLVVGDVAGHGLRAATVMGRIRSAMRAYALLGQGPDEVLRLTDRKMAHFEVGSMATVAIAVFHPPYDEALVALAGHPPFVIAVPGEEPALLGAPGAAGRGDHRHAAPSRPGYRCRTARSSSATRRPVRAAGGGDRRGPRRVRRAVARAPHPRVRPRHG